MTDENLVTYFSFLFRSYQKIHMTTLLPENQTHDYCTSIDHLPSRRHMSGLSLKKDTYVTSWEIDLLPDEENKILYKYTVSGPDGVSFVASAEMTRI